MDKIDKLVRYKLGEPTVKLKTLSGEQLCKYYHIKYNEDDTKLHAKLQVKYIKETMENL